MIRNNHVKWLNSERNSVALSFPPEGRTLESECGKLERGAFQLGCVGGAHLGKLYPSF